MRILYDHQIFSIQRYGGISRYFANLNAGINQQPPHSSSICDLYSTNAYLTGNNFALNPTVGNFFFKLRQKRIYRWNRRYSKLKLRLSNFDLFHPTYYDPYFFDAVKKPFVVTVHDMIHEKMPELFPDTAEVIARKTSVLNKANAIIAISDYTRQDIIRFMPALEPKITVVHHGYLLNSDAEYSTIALPAKYILYVGERWHYKNFDNFIAALAPFLQQDPDLKLICAGGGPFTANELKIFEQLKATKQCMQYNVSDAILKQLYSNALFFAFPSLQEGFGLPILEAFANNCPVVCSNTTSLPEIAGNAAVYFNPTDQASMSKAFAQVISNEEMRAQLTDAGTKRLQNFSFATCLNATLNIYQSII